MLKGTYAAVFTIAMFVAAVAAAPPASEPKVRITISRETTFVVGPVGPDGFIDYRVAYEAIWGEGVTPDNNAATLLVKAFGQGFFPVDGMPTVRRLLGLTTLPPDEHLYISLDDCALEQATDEEAEPVPRPLDEWEKEQIEAELRAGRITAAEARRRLAKTVPGPSIAEQRARQQRERALDRPWRSADAPVAAAWVAANERSLALIMEASKRPRYYLAFTRSPGTRVLIDIQLPALGHVREGARALTARALLRAGEGDTDGALNDLLALHRLARLVSQGGTLMEALVGVAVDVLASAADHALIAHGKLSTDQARTYLTELSSLRSMASVSDIIDRNERMSMLSVATYLARSDNPSRLALMEEHGLESELLTHVFQGSAGAIDWDVVLRGINARMDGFVTVLSISDASARRRAMTKFEQRFMAKDRQIAQRAWAALDNAMVAGTPPEAALRPHATDVVGVHMRAFIPNLGGARDLEEGGAMYLDLTRIALAMEIGKAEHGRYPNKLRYLAPTYMKAVPVDRFSGGALIFRREGAGYVLYSVGKNLRDDGGKTSDDGPDFDDIVIRIK